MAIISDNIRKKFGYTNKWIRASVEPPRENEIRIGVLKVDDDDNAGMKMYSVFICDNCHSEMSWFKIEKHLDWKHPEILTYQALTDSNLYCFYDRPDERSVGKKMSDGSSTMLRYPSGITRRQERGEKYADGYQH
jgi:hypothetical protein